MDNETKMKLLHMAKEIALLQLPPLRGGASGDELINEVLRIYEILKKA